MTFGRRTFLLILAAIGAAFGIFRSRHSIKVFFSETEKRAPRVPDHNYFRRRKKSLVAAVGGRDAKEMVGRAVSLIGGFESLRLKGKSVLIKPNVVGERSNPTTTNPEVVQAVVELLYEAGASKVYVGDMSALIRGGTAKNMEQTGIGAAARRAGAETVYFEDHDWVKVDVDGRYVREVEVTSWFYRVDRVINLPVIKTHRYAGYSICLKNFVGATHFSQRPYLVDREHWEEVVVELNLAFSPDLHIVDGIKAMIAGGPWQGTTVATNVILAGGDRIACDVVGLGIIKSFGRWKPLEAASPWQMRQLKRAATLGLGAKNSDELELLTASLDNDPAFKPFMEKVRTLVGLDSPAANA